ncbi:MAG: ParA family protein, partial [Alphaproteobacteria bacterium]|nr:ParA family protein [Alphaproteobacteria bacterium]
MDGNSVGESLATAEVEAPARPVIVVVCNRKGGVAKSTTATNLAVTLAAFGYDTVLVDLDPQADATRAMRQVEAARGSFDLVLGDATLLDVGVRTPFEGLALVPATPTLALADIDAASLRSTSESLRERLGTPDGSPDFAIFDCPPYLGAASVMAMAAADMALIPVAPTPSAAEGLSGTWTTLTQLKRSLGSGGAVLLIGADTDDPVSTVMTERIRQNFGEALLRAVIPPDSTVEEAAFHGLPVVVYDHKAPSAARYIDVAMEMLERLHQRPGVGPLRHPRKLSDTLERLESWRRALAPPPEALAMLARASAPPP